MPLELVRSSLVTRNYRTVIRHYEWSSISENWVILLFIACSFLFHVIIRMIQVYVIVAQDDRHKLHANSMMGNSKSNHHIALREMPPHVKQLHLAVMTNDQARVNVLIEKGVNVNYPWYNPSNPSVKDGATPLLIAVSLNHTEIITVSTCADAALVTIVTYVALANFMYKFVKYFFA